MNEKHAQVAVKNISFPCMNVILISASMIQANDYNPNCVADPEMNLLIHSIEEDGLTQPVVTFFDPELNKYVVIDGFHRYRVLTEHFRCSEIPVVVLNKPINERMASTIRHNRARGKHQVDLMGVLVKNLSEQGWSDIHIAKHLGMEGEELLRLRQQEGCAKYLASNEYSQAWEYREG
jgi:ParB-like chromosome segregation protein Spo0J